MYKGKKLAFTSRIRIPRNKSVKKSKALKKSSNRDSPLLEGNALDIIATKNKNYRSLKEDMAEMTLLQLIDYLVLRPRLLKQPIIYEGNKIQTGFNIDHILQRNKLFINS
ncbi:ArsC/Spx/MgsR family protein [Lactococcus lactis]|uniref:ArsC/Spx/MgsR family protein n=1 Tax=Lactococcus lactis TaxID=1358 RepID=UPI003D805DF1